MAFAAKPYLSLEDPDTRAIAEAAPRGLLAAYPEGAVIDEAAVPGMWVLTGSQQFGLMSGITQSLAGRVGLVQLLPFSVEELRGTPGMPSTLDEMLVRGCYPPLYDRPVDAADWLGCSSAGRT